MVKKKDATRETSARPAGTELLFPLTAGVEEGPYYKSGSPERSVIWEKGVPGEKVVLSGYVRDVQGIPIANAWLDFWQANGKGEYDNEGYTLRGHQYTDKAGRYKLETVLPAGYAQRTPHIHVKVRANDDSPILTTQLFIPGVATNKTDFLFKDEVLIKLEETAGDKKATFNFVVVKK